ncbi:TPA: hypothetical protein N0F65_010016 [Lagenidium giganteum]|uniref:DNA-directed DNA polymerase n=1 Tax=Lagenidium giganteum TaxID=4803 RepID=A0AAV2ZES0_9STRA|nr:TPA: hypothetical protein N0F65_010016 [Lagenidium giganteum]
MHASVNVVESIQQWRSVVHQGRVSSLTDWLGFSLIRNPFVVGGGLDAVISQKLDTDVALYRRPHPAPVRLPSDDKSASAGRKKPHRQLAKPLVSIAPDDDVADGGCIRSAMDVLVEEEAMHGRLRAWGLAQSLLSRAESMRDSPAAERDGNEHINKKTWSTYDEIAAVKTQLQHSREHYRHEWEKKCVKMMQMLTEVLSEEHREARVSALKLELKQLEVTKEKARRARKTGVSDREQDQKKSIRKKTVQRSRAIAREQLDNTEREHGDLHADNTTEIAVEFPSSSDDTAVLIPPSVAAANAASVDKQESLDAKRAMNWQKREAEHARQAQLMFERQQKRLERALMRMEEERSATIERRERKRLLAREQRQRLERAAAVPIFTGLQKLSGKKYLVSMYKHRAKGYVLDGFRVVAYDPSSSSTFSLLMSRREYVSLGYGTTVEGMMAFCQWLCLIYEKRKRSFRLVWSGAPCPPPLRVREYDQVLICFHREGVKTGGSFHLVSLFLRTTEPNQLHWVIMSGLAKDVDTCEKIVMAKELLYEGCMIERADTVGNNFVGWKHGNSHTDNPIAERKRLYSGDLAFNGRRATVHVHDVSATEYELQVDLPASDNVSASPLAIVLLKKDVNPYNVRLPHSAYGELLGCVQFEQLDVTMRVQATSAWRAVVQPVWFDTLAKYVRIIRLSRCSCKIGSKFYFATLYVVQQKTEFRSYIMIELTWIPSTTEDIMRRMVVRISVSEYLHCTNAMKRIVPVLASAPDCQQCSLVPTEAVEATPSLRLTTPRACPACTSAQVNRLESLHRILCDPDTAMEPLDRLKQSWRYCRDCGNRPDPIVILLGISRWTTEEHVQNLSHNGFICVYSYVSLQPSAAQNFRDRLFQSGVVVVVMADIGLTAQSVRAFGDQLQWRLFPEYHRLPVALAVCMEASLTLSEMSDVLETRRRNSPHGTLPLRNDLDLFEHVDSLATTARDLQQHSSFVAGVNDTVVANDLLNFEAYLVTEALVVEATRVLLDPTSDWKMPGATVGASSWSFACTFLQSPSTIGQELNACDPIHIPAPTRELLAAYKSHAKWPAAAEAVRPPFRLLLRFMELVLQLQRILVERGGAILDHRADISLSGSEWSPLVAVIAIALPKETHTTNKGKMVGLLKGGFTLLSVAYETSTVVMDIVLNTEYIKRKWIHEYILSLVFLTLSGVTMGIVGLALETRRPNRYVRNDHLNKTVAFLIGVLQLRVLVETFHVTSANIKKTRRDKELGLTHDEERPNSESGAPSPNGTSANKDLQRLKDGLTYATFVQGIIRDVPVFIIQANATIHYRKWLLVDLWAVCSSGLTLVHAVATYVTKQNEGAFMVAALPRALLFFPFFSLFVVNGANLTARQGDAAEVLGDRKLRVLHAWRILENLFGIGAALTQQRYTNFKPASSDRTVIIAGVSCAGFFLITWLVFVAALASHQHVHSHMRLGDDSRDIIVIDTDTDHETDDHDTAAPSSPTMPQRRAPQTDNNKLLHGQRVFVVPYGPDVSRKRLEVWREMVVKLGGSVVSTAHMVTTGSRPTKRLKTSVKWEVVDVAIISDQLEPDKAKDHLGATSFPPDVQFYTPAWLTYLLAEKKFPPCGDGFKWNPDAAPLSPAKNEPEAAVEAVQDGDESESHGGDDDGSDLNRADNSEIKRAPIVRIDFEKIEREEEALQAEKDKLVKERIPIFYANNPGFRPISESGDASHTKQEHFICQKTSVMQQNLNAHLTDPLEELMEYLQVEKDIWRAYSYKKIISSLKVMRTRVSRVSDLKGLWWAKGRMRDKVVEILETGKMEKLEAKKVNPRLKTLVDFTRVWGIGPTTATKLYSLDDLRDRGQDVLSHQQKIGLKHFQDFLTKIPRQVQRTAEVAEIEKTVVDEVHRIIPNATAMACGSYRRAKLFSGDCDILITDPDRDDCTILPELLDRLHASGFLTGMLFAKIDDLTHVTNHHIGGSDTYMGVCRLSKDHPYRRLDIKVYPRRFFGFALLYFTGSDHFNRSMRLFARKKGWSLSDKYLKKVVRNKGVGKIEVGESVVCYSEIDVFIALGVEYKDPIERNCFDIRFLDDDEEKAKTGKQAGKTDEDADELE